MGSLSVCLTKAKKFLDSGDIADVKAAYKDYLDDGVAGGEAAMRAVDAIIDQVLAERAIIVAQIEKAGGKATAVPGVEPVAAEAPAAKAEADRLQVKPGEPEWDFIPNSGWRDHQSRARVYAAALRIPFKDLDTEAIVAAIDKKMAEHVGAPEGVSLMISDTTLDVEEARIKGGEFKAVAQRKSPWKSEAGYGSNPLEAAKDAIRRIKPAQSSLVPEATTKEKIAAEDKTKSEKGKAASDDAGPLFNPDAGKQADLVDLAKAPERTPSEIVGTLSSKAMAAKRMFDSDGNPIGTEPAKQPDAPKAETAETVSKNADTKADSDPLAPLVVVLRGAGFKTIIEARKFVKELGILPADASNKQIDETVETAVVAAARQIVKQYGDAGHSSKSIFEQLTRLYGNQPNLASRTGTSVANQAYSTPMPLAYVASRLAGVKAAADVYEPTAGNGALLIEADPTKTTANEIDPDRAAALKAQGFTVTSKDGAEIPTLTDIDSVIMNPPFGAVKEGGKSKVFELGDLTTTKIDHAISLNALEAMADDGKAVLIIGGTKAESVKERTASYRGMNLKDAKTGKGRDNFYRVLYDRYNVTDHFTVSGDLYTKQGASWPVDVIVIEGRGKSSRPLPGTPQGVPSLLKTWEEIAEKIPDDAANDRTSERPARKPVERDERPAPVDEVRGEQDGGTRPVAGKPEKGTKPAPVRKDDPVGQSEGDRGDAVGQGDVPAGGRGDGGGVDRDRAPRRDRVKVKEGATQAKYEPISSSKSVDTLVPASMVDSTRNAMERVEQRHGSVDDFVRDQLGYESDADGMYFIQINPETGERVKKRPFSAEQIDAIALAIDNVERGDAIVVGDATGIGKGRIGAGMLRYAIKKGLVPVLMTEKMDLYGDMYRDMRDIGVFEMLGREPKILTTDVGKSIPLDEEAVSWKADMELAEEAGEPLPPRRGKFLSGGTSQAKDKAYDRLLAGDATVADVMFTTYSQMQTLGEGRATPRRRTVLDAIAPRAMMVLDETHNAGGQGVVDDTRGAKSAEGGRAEFVRALAGKAKGLMFMSATYAKRPNVMDLYARTDMGKAVQDIKDLPTLIQRGGVPMQQIVASMLSESGQYLRRERSFDGIEYAVEEATVDEVAYDQFVGSVQSIFKFDLDVKDTRDEIIEEILDGLGAGKKGQDGGVGEASARSTGFASIMHNIVSQMLLAIKANAAADRAIAALKAGEKPVITLANTNESFISDFASMDGTRIGGTLDIDFGSMLKRYLQRTLRVTYKKAGDTKPSHYQIPIERLPASLQKAYRDVEALIDQGDYEGMPVSPIDWIRSRITKAGYTVREVTGRKTMLDYSRNEPKLVVRPKGESGSGGKRVTLSKFNGGTLDVVILNQSGSTGVSMHSSETFSDKRKRRMILAQAEANIDTHMQMLGRVNRTGQVILPSYSQLAAGIPAETRPTIVLMKKMASLNANTTGARGSAFTAEAADFMNEVGDKVMAEYLWENPEINLALGEPYDGVEVKDVVQKATGKLVLLTVAQQREMLETVQKNYVREIEQLDALGENPLEAKMLDLQAETLETVELKARTGDSPFLDAVRIEKVSAKAQGRAMPVSEIVEAVSERLKTPKPEGSEQSALEALERKGREWMSGESRRVQELARRQLTEELAETKPDSREGVRSRQLATMSRWQQTMNVAYPGARVSLGMPSGDLDGIVMSVERSGKAHGIAALSAWTVKIAVPDSARQFEFPMSKLFPPGITKSEDEKGATISSARTFFPMMIKAFEEARKEGRETRHIVTGNILGGYDQTKGKGRIVNFTTKDGQVRPGVLMERGFEVGKFMKDRAVRFGSGEQIATFIDRVSDVEVAGRDGELVLGKGRRGYYVQMSKARGKAGKYYTDKAVRATIDPKEFTARGNKMMAEDLSRAQFVAAVEEMRKIGAAFETTTAQDEAQAIIADSQPAASIGLRSVSEATRKRTVSRLDYVKGRILLRQPVDLSEDADRMFDLIKSEGSVLPDSIPETVVTKLLPKLGSPGQYIVTVRDKNGTQYSYEDDSKLIPKTQGMYLLLDGRPAVTLLPLDFGGDFVKSVVGVRAHEAVHALRVNGFLPGSGRDLASPWGRLVGHSDVLGVLSMSRSELYERMGDPRSETASKEVTTLEVYTELYGNRKYARELLDQEAVAHMVEVYKLGGWSEQEVAPIKDLLDDILSGRTGQQERASLSLDMLRSIQDTDGAALSLDAKIANIEAITDHIRSLTETRRPLNPKLDVVTQPDRNGRVAYYVLAKGKNVWNRDGSSSSSIIGRFDVKPSQRMDATGVEVTNAKVEETHQRQGIGTAVYDMVASDFEAFGGLSPSPDNQLSPNAQALWKQRLTSKAEAAKTDIEKAINDAVAIVSRIAGTGVQVQTAARIPFWQFTLSDEQIEARARSRGPRDPGGVYQQIGDGRALITLAYADPAYDIRTTAGHEAYHHVEEVLASPAEMKLLRSPSEMERATRHAAAEIGMSVEETRKLPDYEIRAIAFQRYRRLREEGATMTPLHVGVRRMWDRLVRMFQAVRNALRGQGFDSMEAIFERARSGEMASSTRGQVDASPQPLGAQEDSQVANPEAMASFFPTATSSGTFFGRRIAAQMRRMAPASDQWRVRLQDKFLMVRRQQEEIERKSGSSLPLPVDVYVAESLFHGRAGERMADLQQKRVEPLVEHLRKHEIDADELGDYLYARHAQERNAYIRTIDPANDAGSGMTDADAQAILGRVQGGSKAQAFADASTMIDQINKETRSTLLSAGLITRETFDAWSNDYQHYVPLRGFEVNDEEQVFPRVGKGFNVRGPEAFQALGRRSKSDNPVAYVLLQAQQAIVRAEKNRVNKTLLRLVETHPDPDVWQVYRGEYKRVLKTDPATGQDYVDTVFVPPQFSAHDPSIVGVKVGGKQHYIQIHNPNLARALRGVGSSEFDHAIVRNMMALTRFYAQLLTSWNPEFVVGNFFRDVQAALLNSKDVADLPAGARKKMLAEALSLTSIRGIYNALRGDGSHPHAHYFEEFRQAGGKISFMEYSDVERIKSRINGLLTEGKTMRAIRRTAKYVEDVNTSVENGVRLSTYIAMREAGIARDRAASVARELTVNFNRKGEWGPIINAAYMFFNASVQGSTRMLQAIAKSKAVRRAVYAIAFGGLAMEMLNYIISGDDDDKENAYDKIKPWVKERNMIFMLPGRKDYLMIPMPYGYNVPYVAGQKIGEMARSAAGYGKTTPAKAAAGIMDAMMGSFNPLGTSPTTSFLQMMSPTILDPVVQVAENKSWFGGPIYPTKFDKNKPDSENYFASVHPAFIEVARWLNRGTGGNAAKSGIVDVSPEVLEHYATFLGGGVAKFLLNATGTGQRALAGEEFIPEKTPIVRRLYGSQTSTSRRSEFYEAWTKVDGAHYEVIQLNKAGDREGMERARTENKAELEAYGAMRSTQQALSKYSKQRTQIQLNREMPEAEKKSKIDEIKGKENEIILRAMAVYNRAQKQKGSGGDRKLRLSDEDSEANKQQLGGLMKLLGKSGIALTERQSSNVEDRRGDQVSDEDLRDAQIESIYDLLRDDQRMAQQRTGRELQEASEITRSVPRIPK